MTPEEFIRDSGQNARFIHPTHGIVVFRDARINPRGPRDLKREEFKFQKDTDYVQADDHVRSDAGKIVLGWWEVEKARYEAVDQWRKAWTTRKNAEAKSRYTDEFVLEQVSDGTGVTARMVTDAAYLTPEDCVSAKVVYVAKVDLLPRLAQATLERLVAAGTLAKTKNKDLPIRLGRETCLLRPGRRGMTDIDVTPGAHSPLDALATVSFKLGCGCTKNHHDSEPTRRVEIKSVGSEYPCRRHGDQVITRATFRLGGWRNPPVPRWRP